MAARPTSSSAIRRSSAPSCSSPSAAPTTSTPCAAPTRKCRAWPTTASTGFAGPRPSAACTAADPVAGRAGLVGTQNIRNNQSRVGGLDYICADRHDRRSRGQPAVVRRSQRPRLHRQLGEDAGRRPAAQNAALVQGRPGRRKSRASGSGRQGIRTGLPRVRADQLGAVGSSRRRRSEPSWNATPNRNAASMGKCSATKASCFSRASSSDRCRATPEVRRSHSSPTSIGVEHLTGDGTSTASSSTSSSATCSKQQPIPGAFEWVKANVLPDARAQSRRGQDEDGKMRSHHKHFSSAGGSSRLDRPEMLVGHQAAARATSSAPTSPSAQFSSSSRQRIRPSNALQVFGFRRRLQLRHPAIRTPTGCGSSPSAAS